MALCRSDDAGAPDVLIAFFVPLVPINQAHCAIDRERTTLQPVARGPSSRLGRCILRATMVDAYEWIRAAGDPGAKPQATADFDDGYRICCLVDAMLSSHAAGGVWQEVAYIPEFRVKFTHYVASLSL
jgi:hypothetical protein